MARPRLADDFLRGIADDYAKHANSRRPSEDIAAERGVPAATVRTWVMRARRRGLLAPRTPPQRRRDAALRAEAYREAADEIDARYTGPNHDRYARYAAAFLRERADIIAPPTTTEPQQ